LDAPIAVMHQPVGLADWTIVERLLQGIEARSLRSEVDARPPTIRREKASITGATPPPNTVNSGLVVLDGSYYAGYTSMPQNTSAGTPTGTVSLVVDGEPP
jgi:hypothetical protein